MKILVMSDTHGDKDAVAAIINRHRDADMIIHLGDNYMDALDFEREYPAMRFEGVPGNCDYNFHNLPEGRVIKEEGVKLFITHGKNYYKMLKKAKDLDCDIFLFGHTHVFHWEKDPEIFLINPGSPSIPRGASDKSYVVLKLEDGKYKVTKEVFL